MINATKEYYAQLCADRPLMPGWDELDEKQQAKVAKAAYTIFNMECELAANFIAAAKKKVDK
jgi:hypothetical protein